MADQPPPPPPPSGASMAPHPGAGAPGTSHMPPPAMPLTIEVPPNTNPIPGVMLSPINNGQQIMSPLSAGGFVRRAAPEPNKRALYVGGLDPRVTEDMLKQIFQTVGSIMSVKIIPDKNFNNATPKNYGFVDFDDPAGAERAMQVLNGRKVMDQEIRVNWAYQSNTSTKEDTTSHHHIFVGDLSNEVSDDILQKAFSIFGTVSEARVMWDYKTGRSRGFGFVSYRSRDEAEKAMAKMDGEWLGSRQIRCNWANQKGQPPYAAQQQQMVHMGMQPASPYSHPPFPSGGMQSYEVVLSQAPSYQATCYVGNLTPNTVQGDLVPLFMNFGPIVEARMQSDRGFAFIKMQTHEAAAAAICNLNGYMVKGRPIKCSWGKERPPTMSFDGQQSPSSASFPYSPQASSPFPGGYPQSAGSYGAQFNQYGSGIPSPQAQAGFALPYHPSPSSAGGYGRPPPPPPPPPPAPQAQAGAQAQWAPSEQHQQHGGYGQGQGQAGYPQGQGFGYQG